MTTAESHGSSRPQAAGTPEFKFVPFVKELFQRIGRDRVTMLAQAVAFNLVFAIPPLLVLLVMVAALVQHSTGAPITANLTHFIDSRAPGSARTILDTLVNDAIGKVHGSAISFGLVISILLALWGGSNGVGALIQAFNVAYEVRAMRNIVASYALQIALTLAMIVFIIAAFALFIFGHQIGLWIANSVGLGSVFTVAWDVLRWPVAILLILILLALLYYFGPYVKQSFRWVTPGSAVAATLWVIATLGFRLYLALSNPGSAYGAAGSVIVLLFYFYVTGLIFIVGAEIDAMVQVRRDPVTIQDLASHPEKVSERMHRDAVERAAAMGLHYKTVNPSDSGAGQGDGGSAQQSFGSRLAGLESDLPFRRRGKGREKSGS
ncbi:MAG TPA: YihY/virulence factor BrkB family protein [Thermomicrobiaceae bacterium]|nr:YihY/virulence factor BrkB family protein [Thermomicrobiaceae bacterium]